MSYYPNINYKGINCQLLYIDETSYYYSGRIGWVLIADGKKSKLRLYEELGFERRNDVYMLDIGEDTAQSLISRYNEEQNRLSSLMRSLYIPLIYFICLIFLWKVPIYMQIGLLDLPEGAQTVYRTKAHISDVIETHIRAEKVIKYDGGYDRAKDYIEKHNSKFLLWHIDVYEYGGMSDLAIYDADFDHDRLALPRAEKDKYVKIVYQRSYMEPTPLDILTLVMVFWFFGCLAELIRLSVGRRHKKLFTFKIIMVCLTLLHIFVTFGIFFLVLALYAAFPTGYIFDFLVGIRCAYGEFIDKLGVLPSAALTALFFLCCFAFWRIKNKKAPYKFWIFIIIFNTFIVYAGHFFFLALMSV